MELDKMRYEIDEIDNKMAALLKKRMDVATRIAEYKAERKLPVYDPQRERQKLYDIASKAGERMAPATDALFSLLFDLSRAQQHRIIEGELPLIADIKNALVQTENKLPSRPVVACQGMEGAFSQQAGERIFPRCNIMYFNSFEGVFSAIEQGMCQYGVLPVENNTAGSVNRVYDLMMKKHFYIVRSIRVKVDHCLLANKGAKLESIKEIYSHEQAIAQCADFLKTLTNVKIVPCENTASAAQAVMQSGREDFAALCSDNCAEIYDLECLRKSVQDQGGNYTRFICISRKLEIYPGSDRTSLMMVLPHKQGSLYRTLSCFHAHGINLLKIESRPLPDTDFEFMFYFDLELSMYSDELLRIFKDLAGLASELQYLGTYLEEC